MNNRIAQLPGGFIVDRSPSLGHSSLHLARRALGVTERVAAGLVTVTYAFAGAGFAFGWAPGPLAAGVAAGTATALYTVLLVVRALVIHTAAGSFAPCRGVGFLGMGVLAGGSSLVVAITGPVGEGPYLAAAGVAASAVLFLLGLLLLPGTAPSLASRLRRVLDGVAIGLCLFFAGWVLVVMPLTRSHAGPVNPDATTVIVLVMVLSAALAVTALIGVRAVLHRASALFCCAGVAVCLVPQATVALLLLVGGGWGLVLATVAVWASGPVLIWAGARRSAERTTPVRRRDVSAVVRLATTTPLLAGSAGLGVLGAIYHLVAFGSWGVYTAMIAVSAATAVGARGMFASLDVCRYTTRLVDQENRFLTTDPLTAIPNRLRLRHRLEVERSRAQVGVRCGTLLVIDLDNFGDVDDVLGHDVGDAVLMEVARRLRTSVGARDLAVRLAGDSFAVLTVEPPDYAAELAGRLRTELATPYRTAAGEPGSVHLTSSIGVAECNTAATVDEMIRAGELAVSSAKDLGGDRVERYDESLELQALRRRTFAHELRGAVQRGELDLLYAPVVELAGGAAVGLRAQARWRHPTLGVVSEAELRAAAEDTGLTGEIGDWILRRAVRQFGRWIDEGRDLWLSVRISSAQLRCSEFASHVVDLRREFEVPPHRLVLEISEEVLTAGGAAAGPLAALRDAEVRTSLAGFGAGRCSLLELRELPIDRLAIDEALVTGLAESEPIVVTVVDLARRLGLEVVADGVTETWQADLLRSQRCRYAQGPLFSRPVPAEYAEAYLDAHAGGTDSANLRP